MPLSEMQREYIRKANRRWNIKTGATRSGKTHLDIIHTIPRRVIDAGQEGLIVLMGNTQETIHRNVIEPMRNIWGPLLVGNVRLGSGSMRLFGRKAYVIGADKRDRVHAIQGTGMAYCYGDEITTWAEEVFEMLKSRLDKPTSIFDGTCNPAGPGHWFKRFLDSGADIYQQRYTIDDNPFLPRNFVVNLKQEYAGSVRYDRFILGRWVRAEGLIYRSFDPAMHAVNDANGVDRIWFAVDVGHSNATAFLALGIGGDGRLYVLDEYYHSGRDAHLPKSPLAYARDFIAFRDRVIDAYGAAFAGVYIDPSAAGFSAQLREAGCHSVYRANNSVLPGIAKVASLIDADGLHVLKRCEHTLKELSGYVWDASATAMGEDRPVKTDDHCMDALRYGVMAARRRGRTRGVDERSA